MKSKKNLLRIILLFFIISLFFRIDFRFKSSVECCSDDFDYFSHAETIVIDRDFDYTNQLPPNHSFVYKNLENGKIAPVGFPGAGILAVPFFYMGNLIDEYFNPAGGSEILNYTLLFYSLSPVVYFFASIILIFKSCRYLNLNVEKYKLLTLISGSGITYFAFERFSMTHIYEMFIISLLIWNCINFYKNDSNLSASFIPISLMISFLVRMSNYYVFLIPYLIKLIMPKKTKNIFRNLYFQISSALSIYLYSTISHMIYGKLMFNPQEVYGTNVTVGSVLNDNNNLLDFLITKLSDLFIIIFGNEFGIFWVSPIIFSGFLILFLNIKNINKSNFLLLICFLQNLAIVLIWRSTAASYGFRYLYSLVPLCIIILYLHQKKSQTNRILYLAVLMSIFSNLSLLFFETTEQTQLSMIEIENSFGLMRNYSEPNYVTGVFKSFTELNSYLIIFTTSFVGVVFFKILLLLFDKASIFNFLNSLGLPTDNQDFIKYLENLEIISVYKIMIIFLTILFFCIYFVNNLNNKNN